MPLNVLLGALASLLIFLLAVSALILESVGFRLLLVLFILGTAICEATSGIIAAE